MLGTWVDNVTAILEADEFKPLLNSGLRGRPPTIVSESGLYALVLKSRKPEAKAFRKWVTSEVLPSIRRHGGLHDQGGRCDGNRKPCRFPSPCPAKGV